MKKYWLWIAFCLLFFMIGIVVGMLMGTYTVIDTVAQGLSGSTFIVNLNETKLVEEFNKTIIPEIKKEFEGEKNEPR